MASPNSPLDRLEELLAELERLPEPAHGYVFEFLDTLDGLHRAALMALADDLGEDRLGAVAARRSEVSWLLSAYEIAVDQRPEAEAAVESVRPYIASHGGSLEIVEARQGVVRVRLAGNCSGCTASATTLERGVEQALRRHMPSFERLEVEPDDAPPHPPPAGPVLPIHAAADPAGDSVLSIHRVGGQPPAGER